jgi:prephenate dehydratase
VTHDRLGYLGPRGTLSEEAAEALAPALGVAVDGLVAQVSVPAALAGVRTGETRWALAPAENSLEGSVGLTWDCLISTVELAIVGEAVWPVVHHLLGRRGLAIGSVVAVLSHQQALGQCRSFLQSRLPRAKQYETGSTAEAARVVSVNELPLAAIGSARAAQLYGLDILARNIQDVVENATRFLLVGKAEETPEPTGGDRTSLVCALERDRPGALYEMLGAFARRGINLSRLESRPARRQLGEYVFLIDAAGHAAVEPLTSALAELRAAGSLLRVLGSYPRHGGCGGTASSD